VSLEAYQLVQRLLFFWGGGVWPMTTAARGEPGSTGENQAWRTIHGLPLPWIIDLHGNPIDGKPNWTIDVHAS
jgi:hypothetical protein